MAVDMDELDERWAVEEPLLPLDERESPQQRRQKWSRGRRVAVALVAVGVVLGVIYAVVASQVQAIATKAIRTTAMDIARMQLTHPEADSIRLNISLSLTSTSAFPAQVEATHFTIVYQSQAVGRFLSPEMTIRHGINAVRFPNSTLEIQNRTAWDAFARDMMQSRTLEYEIRARLGIAVRLLGGLVTFHARNVPLEKKMTLKGMDGLRTMLITEIEMTNSTQTQVRASIKTCIYNPSITALQPVGGLCLHAHYPNAAKDTLVAHLTTPKDTGLPVANDDASHPYCASFSSASVDMSKGYNLLQLQGEMLGTNPAAISGLISKYLSNVSADLTVVTCSPQATTVDLFNKAMQNLSIPSILPPQKEPLVGKMFFNKISLQPPEAGKENTVLGLETVVAVEATSPLGPHSTLTISDVRMKVKLIGAGSDLGVLSTTEVHVLSGNLTERSNISVDCVTELAFADNGALFGKFVRASVVQDKVALGLEGEMDVIAHGALGVLHLSGLPLQSTVQLDGMNNFTDVEIESFSLPGTGNPTQRGEAISTAITIGNPSIFEVSIGNLSLALGLASPREKFGRLSGIMNLRPGKNALRLEGVLEPTIDSHGRVSGAVAGFFSSYLQGSPSNVVVNIVDTQYRKCVWLTHALLGLTIATVFPGVPAGVQMISNISMHQLDVVMTKADANNDGAASNTKMLVRTDLMATVQMPDSIKIPLDISNVSVSLQLEEGSKLPMGLLQSDREQCEYNQSAGGAFRFNMSRFYPIDFKTTKDVYGMGQFVTELLTKNGNVEMLLVSDAHDDQGAFPFVETRMGMLALRSIPINGAPTLPGMDSFRNPPVQILSIDIKNGTPSSMTMEMEFSLKNPSVVRTKLGALVLDVYAGHARMGSAHMADFSLNCCGEASIIKGVFEFNPSAADREAAVAFLSNFVSGYFTHGKPQQIEIKGSASSTPLDVLQPAMRALTIPSALPMLGDLFPATPTLVTSSVLYTPSLFHLTRIPTALELRNPFSESITITAVDLELYPCEVQTKESGALICKKYFDVSLARFAPASFAPIFIPASTSGCFSCCQGAGCEEKLKLCPRATAGQCMSADVQSFLSPEAIAAIIRSATSGLLMKVNGTIHASIGAYATQLFYQQEGLLVTMAK